MTHICSDNRPRVFQLILILFGMVNYRISRRIKSVWLFISCLSLISAGILYLIILML
ncbi:Uncharacterised protein [Segatella copri]|nr:Uncharacterised protein [Segatella copri]